MGMNGRERLVRVYTFRVREYPENGVAVKKLDRPGERFHKLARCTPGCRVIYNPPDQIVLELERDATFPALVEIHTVR